MGGGCRRSEMISMLRVRKRREGKGTRVMRRELIQSDCFSISLLLLSSPFAR
jgi:hypothetical protein